MKFNRIKRTKYSSVWFKIELGRGEQSLWLWWCHVFVEIIWVTRGKFDAIALLHRWRGDGNDGPPWVSIDGLSLLQGWNCVIKPPGSSVSYKLPPHNTPLRRRKIHPSTSGFFHYPALLRIDRMLLSFQRNLFVYWRFLLIRTNAFEIEKIKNNFIILYVEKFFITDISKIKNKTERL